MLKFSRLAFLAMLTASSLLLGCSSTPTPTAAAAGPAPTRSNDAGTSSQSKAQFSSSPEFIASGPIVVENQIDLAAQRDGVVAEILVEAGASVRKGQLLSKLDDRQLTAERDAAAAKVRSLEADLKNWQAGAKVAESERDRSDAMWQANIIAKGQQEKAKYQFDAMQFEVQRQVEDLKMAESSLKSLELELEKTRVTAPFSGIVARRYISLGQQVAKNDRLFWISATSPLRVRFALPESYLGRVQKGSEILVLAPVASGESHKAKVVLVSPVVDPASDTIDVTAELIHPSSNLKPGMTANIRLPESQ
jgi:membrane fusion protein (multidrug efflux system)